MTTEQKRKLQAEVVWAFTRSGAFQRSWIYAGDAIECEKEGFRAAVKDYLYRHVFVAYYKKPVSVQQLRAVTEKLIDVTAGFPFLHGRVLRYGSAQKFVNLYLKGMWIMGCCQTPPHFPADRIMIRKLGFDYNWTTMGKEEYDEVIKRAEDTLPMVYHNMAEWEAIEYMSALARRGERE